MAHDFAITCPNFLELARSVFKFVTNLWCKTALFQLTIFEFFSGHSSLLLTDDRNSFKKDWLIFKLFMNFFRNQTNIFHWFWLRASEERNSDKHQDDYQGEEVHSLWSLVSLEQIVVHCLASNWSLPNKWAWHFSNTLRSSYKALDLEIWCRH